MVDEREGEIKKLQIIRKVIFPCGFIILSTASFCKIVLPYPHAPHLLDDSVPATIRGKQYKVWWQSSV